MNLEELIVSRIHAAQTADDLAESLEWLLAGGFAVWEDGSLYEIRQLVGQVQGLRIEIYPREHPPPHFHVRATSLNASFAIDDCRLLAGSIGGREQRIVQWWHQRSRRQLVQVWNATRPSDCPVGPIVG